MVKKNIKFKDLICLINDEPILTLIKNIVAEMKTNSKKYGKKLNDLL